MTSIKTANSVPMFIGNTLRCVCRQIIAPYKLLTSPEADTCVLFFYIWMAVAAAISTCRIYPWVNTHIGGYSKNVASASRRWDMAGIANPACPILCGNASGRCPISMSRQPHHEKIKETEHDNSGAE